MEEACKEDRVSQGWESVTELLREKEKLSGSVRRAVKAGYEGLSG